ncbi:MAG: hypothetical protein MUE79_05105, partial [Nitratireductor sp.]|nr:hypothetical protein [Nitratireductor sp.]
SQPSGDQVSAYRIEIPLAARVEDSAISYTAALKPRAAVAPQLEIETAAGPVVVPALRIELPGQAVAYSAHAGSGPVAASAFGEKTYGEYLRAGAETEIQMKRIFGPVISSATPASVYQQL